MGPASGIVILALLILIPINGMLWIGKRIENERAMRLAVYLRAKQLIRRGRR